MFLIETAVRSEAEMSSAWGPAKLDQACFACDLASDIELGCLRLSTPKVIRERKMGEPRRFQLLEDTCTTATQ